jgi:hypothetical protein
MNIEINRGLLITDEIQTMQNMTVEKNISPPKMEWTNKWLKLSTAWWW